ncbi:MAG: YciI family protein [Kibdelosporangium sp.]
MKFMVMVKASADTEKGVMPGEDLLRAMTEYNEKLVNAGVLVAGEGLHPSSRGARVRFEGKKTAVIDGPFAEAKELIAGYWIFDVASLDEAVEWVKGVPNPDGVHHEIEIRQVFEAADFGDAMTEDLRAKDAELRAKTNA